MDKLSLRLAALLVCVAALLVACGGGGSGGGNPDDNAASEVPSSALHSVEGLVAYLRELIAGATTSSGEPVRLGDVVLPTSDSSEPVAVN